MTGITVSTAGEGTTTTPLLHSNNSFCKSKKGEPGGSPYLICYVACKPR
jgi:hypothetical protein